MGSRLGEILPTVGMGLLAVTEWVKAFDRANKVLCPQSFKDLKIKLPLGQLCLRLDSWSVCTIVSPQPPI